MIMTRKYIAEYKQKEHFCFTSGMTSDQVGNQSFSMTEDLMLSRDSVVHDLVGWKNIRFPVNVVRGCFQLHLTKIGFETK